MNALPSLAVVDGDDASAASLLESLHALPYRVRREASVDLAFANRHASPVDVVLAHAEALNHDDVGEGKRAWNGTSHEHTADLIVYAQEVGQLQRSIEGGHRDFLLPPFEPERIRRRVEASLGRRRSAAQEADAAKREELLKLERDLQIGRTIQQGFLPAALPQPPGWEITACFHPAREVAGDFYDAFYMINERRVGFVIADVCDKGVGAALFMALFRTLIRANAQHNTSLGWMDAGSGMVADDKDWLEGGPTQRRRSLPNIGTGALMNAVAGTNDYITSNHMEQGYFATMFFGLLDPATGALLYVNGGHNPPVLHRVDGSQTFLAPTGPAVGMLPAVKFKMGHAQLAPGDMLYTYTDGVTDARTASGAFFTESRLFDIVAAGASSAQALVDEVESQLTAHIGDAPQYDDITMLAVRRTPLADHDRAATPRRATHRGSSS